MTFYTRNTEKPWTTDDIATLRKLVRENTPTRVIGLKLGRTEAAIYKKASELGLSLKPTNQSVCAALNRLIQVSSTTSAIEASPRTSLPFTWSCS